jgi:Dyp-type peroxidase family
VDEADEYPAAPIPTTLAANGTFLVYRKLHENVASFDRSVSEEGARFGDPELLAAKLVGRWRNGAPLTSFPTRAEADRFVDELERANAARSSTDPATATAATERYYTLKQQLMAFDYGKDLPGSRCPVGAHVRRANPRGALEFGVTGAFDTPGALSNRRRIARRGLPYGNAGDRTSDDGDHGIIFMAIGASISRQFEFVQQQWMNYGNDARLANDRDPIIGNQPRDGGRMVIPADPAGTQPPAFCTGMPRFVETRGGDYFFVPSLTALASIAAGTIDPT